MSDFDCGDCDCGDCDCDCGDCGDCDCGLCDCGADDADTCDCDLCDCGTCDISECLFKACLCDLCLGESSDGTSNEEISNNVTQVTDFMKKLFCCVCEGLAETQNTPSHVSSDNDRRPKTNGEETPRLAPEGNNPGNMIIDSQPSVITRINGE